MFKNWLIAIISLITCVSCIEELDSTSGEYEKALVVDAFITNGTGPFQVQLAYTTPNIDVPSDPVPNSEVSIEDDLGNITRLNSTGEGLYETPSSFYGEIGRSYKLKIQTSSAYETYESDFCLLRSPACIDEISFSPTEIIDDISNETFEGISLLVDASICLGEETYLRWGIKEDWKFRLPHPKTYEMTGEDTFERIVDPEIYCYDNSEPEVVQVHSFNNQQSNTITNKNIYSVPTTTSLRFRDRYRAIVEQYSISKEEYNFWNKLKESTQGGSDLFGRQPYTLQGNVTCTSSPSKKVLGYFQVAGKTSDTIYINVKEIYNLGLSVQKFERCSLDTVFAKDVDSLFEEYKSWSQRQSFYVPAYDEMGFAIIGLVFSKFRCAKCEQNKASRYPPANWRDK